MSTTATSPLSLFDSALAGASNDEALEMAYRLFEHLSKRAEAIADLAIESDNRDVENEARVFVADIKSVFPSLTRLDRIDNAYWPVWDAAKDIEAVVANRRARLETGSVAPMRGFSNRRMQRVRTAWTIQHDRERKAAEKTVEKAKVTRDRVLEAVESLDGAFGAKDVAIKLLPLLEDAAVPGRQKVIAKVSSEIQALVKRGELEQVRSLADDPKSRKTGLYRRAGDDA